MTQTQIEHKESLIVTRSDKECIFEFGNEKLIIPRDRMTAICQWWALHNRNSLAFTDINTVTTVNITDSYVEGVVKTVLAIDDGVSKK